MTSALDVAVLGAGSWGTALAKLLAEKGHRVRLWSRSVEHAHEMAESRENARYLPAISFPDTLSPTGNLDEALVGVEMVVSVVPTHGLREVLANATPLFPPDATIVSATKGIEQGTHKLVSQIFEDYVPPDRRRLLTFLGGPSFAKEVALGVPTAVSIAGHDAAIATGAQLAFNTDRFRVYTTEDVVGVELGGALKNVIAIAAGICDGLGFGYNSRAGLITRGLWEIARLAMSMGAHPMTLAGLSGMGDLVLTCTGDLSRNRTVGMRLGQGESLEQILASMRMVAEGVRTTKSAHELAVSRDVEMPIIDEVFSVLYEGKPPRDAVVSLMTRPPRHERA